MDQINALKGYGKVTHLELEHQIPPPSNSKPNSHSHSHSHSQSPKHKHLLLLLTVTAAVALSTLLIGFIIGAYLRNHNSKSPSLNSNWADTIKIVCNVSRYPDSCFSSIVALNSSPVPDPEVILKLSLQVSLNDLSNLSGWLKNRSAQAEGLKECEGQIEEAIGLVNDSKVEMEVDPEEKMLTESRISDIQTWMSSAMTNQESCVDGLQEMESASFEEVKTRMRKSMEYVSNSLAIVANIHLILEKFGMPLH